MSGVLCNLPKIILMGIFKYTGLIKYSFAQMSAGVFIREDALSNPFSLAIGVVSDFAVASLLGILLVYIMRITGKDYPISKGVLYGIMIHIVVYGVAKTLNITSVELLNPLANFIVLFPNIIFGIFNALFIERYGILDSDEF
ncbi:hypothetical protein [Sporohalobacter salinus]|uniref:hypothetical protein n=1 Tax=Sporohalobacter salinus TaxID=1494606 RepID=UPI00196129FA|nr:hypothetical protein [Sporohalobacter salinus]MBM7623360.1 hypothetical protein [Sporohalobacter salinus]